MSLPADRHHYVTDNIRLVHMIANRFFKANRDPAIDYNDVFGAGCEGLVHAAKVYDESSGNQFSTIAYRTIWGYMMRQRAVVTPVRMPVNVLELTHQVIKKGFMDATPEDVVKEFGCTIVQAKKALYSANINVFSVNATLPGREDEETYEQFQKSEDDQSFIVVNEFLGLLKPGHRVVVEGLLNNRKLSDIGNDEGVTFQAIGQRMKAIRKRWTEYEAAQ